MLYLEWSGSSIRNVVFESSNQRGTVLKRPGKVAVALSGDARSQEVGVRASYMFRLSPLVRGEGLGYELNSRNLPSSNAVGSPIEGDSPYTRDPDTIVRVRSSQLMVLGPTHTRIATESKNDVKVFSAYRGGPFFALMIGRFAHLATSQGVEVLGPENHAHAIPPDLVNMVARESGVARHYLQTILGPAAVAHKSILIFPYGDRAARSFGSAILLPLNRLAADTKEGLRHRVTEILAHEYAHCWWNYSVFWDDPKTTSALVEAIAIATERYCSVVADQNRIDVIHRYDWHNTNHTVRTSRRSLRKTSSTFAVWSAGVFLSELMLKQRGQETVSEIWKRSVRSRLSLPLVKEALTQIQSVDAASTFVDALTDPKPLIVSTRIATSQNRCSIELRGNRDTIRRLNARIVALGHHATLQDEGMLVLPAKNLADVPRVLYSVEPLHLLSRRSIRGYNLSGRKLALWEWAKRSVRTPVGSFRSVIRFVLSSGIALFLNRDDPLGWLALAHALRHNFSGLARKLEIAAAVRATYYGEDDLRNRLM
jgi:hypothetical protein